MKNVMLGRFKKNLESKLHVKMKKKDKIPISLTQRMSS